MIDNPNDLDDTARLILMDDPEISLNKFAAKLRDECGAMVSIPEIASVWGKYRGSVYGPPTHNIETGALIRR